jgi:VWFA-related protein
MNLIDQLQWGGAARTGMLLLLAGAGSAPASQELALSVNVDLVVLQATVRDRTGVVPGDLRKEDVTVFEDGVRQTISVFRHDDLAVTAGLIVDHSGSMRAKLANVVAASRTFVRNSSSEDEMFVVNFNENVTLGLLPPVHFTNRQDEMAAAIERTVPAGQTALYDAVAEGLQQLRSGSREKRVLIVISDGADNASKHTLAQVLRLAAQSNAAIYTIGIFGEDDPDRNPGVLRKLSHATGGESFVPTEERTVTAICEQIAKDIRRQYTIGYVSNSMAAAGTFREIRVKAEAPGHGKLTVRTRSGYVAGGVQ